jgi:hypothetical protein
MLWLAPTLALAGEVPGEDRVGLSVRLLGEALADPELSAAYGGTGLGGEVAVTVPVIADLHVTLEGGYLRRAGHFRAEDGSDGAASYLWYLPMALPASWVLDLGPVRVGAGLGPAYLLFAEPNVSDNEWGESGGKFGFVVEARGRVHTAFVRRSLYDPGGGPSRMDVTFGLGYRHAIKHVLPAQAGEGHDFSAARVDLGLERVY